jgi:hypothetical protein
MPRFRPRFERLEDRRTPALSVLSQGGDLTITGTPEAVNGDPFVGWAESLSVTRVSGDSYRVVDGGHDHGVFRASRNIALDLSGIDNNVVVDLAGGRLAGDVTIDLGAGDRDPATVNLVVVAGGGGRVGGSVTLSGASVALRGASPFDTGGVVVGARLLRGSFELEGKTYHYTAAEDSPVAVGRDVTAVRQPADTVEDVFYLGAGSVVERNVIIQGVSHTVIAGGVGRDLTVLADVAADPSPGSGNMAELAVIGSVGRDLRFAAEGAGGAEVVLFGEVARDVAVTFATPAGTRSSLFMAGSVGGNLTVSDGAGDLEVHVGSDVGRNLVVNAGAGDDKVFIAGDHDFRLDARMGGGDDAVEFAPDASVGSARIEFGTTGTNTLILPFLVAFPLEVINL